ncbi:MAG: tetratricopeptide repeat protein [Leptospirillia bacterium]
MVKTRISSSATAMLAMVIAVFVAAVGVGWLVMGVPGPDGVVSTSVLPKSPSEQAQDTQAAAMAGEVAAHLENAEDPHFAALSAALSKNPGDVEALLSMGYLFVQRREYSKARGYYLRASQVAPGNLEARAHLGTVAYFLGNVKEALHHYDQVLAVDPNYTVALFEVGAVLRYGARDLPRAVEAWEKFLALDPTAAEAEKIRELVAEAKGMIADGTAPEPVVFEDHPTPDAAPDTAPWPGESVAPAPEADRDAG